MDVTRHWREVDQEPCCARVALGISCCPIEASEAIGDLAAVCFRHTRENAVDRGNCAGDDGVAESVE
jgi:hypothetical protein